MFYNFEVILDRFPTEDEIRAGMRTPSGVAGLYDEDPPVASMCIDTDNVSWTEVFAEAVTEVEELGVRAIGFRHDHDGQCCYEHDMAVRFGMSEQYALELAAGLVGPGGFPPRAKDDWGDTLEYWEWGPVRDWFREHFGSDVADRYDRLIDTADQELKSRLDHRR